MTKLTEETGIDQVTAQRLPAGRWVVNVRAATRILRGGAVVSETYHRHVLEPGADLKAEDPLVAAIAKAAWKKV